MAHKTNIMSRYTNMYVVDKPKVVPMDQLIQLLRIVWDGDLISKSDRDTLVEMGYAERSSGFQVITGKGISFLAANGYIIA